MLFKVSNEKYNRRSYHTNHFLLKIQESTHLMDCPTSSTCVNRSWKFFNIPSLIRQIRTIELKPQSAQIILSVVNVMSNVMSNVQIQQLWTRLKKKKSTIHRIIMKVRAKYLWEVGICSGGCSCISSWHLFSVCSTAGRNWHFTAPFSVIFSVLLREQTGISRPGCIYSLYSLGYVA